MALLVSALGFDEKFLIRALWRRGAKEINAVLVVVPTDDEKGRNALQSFINFAKSINISVDVVEVEPKDFVGSVIEIANAVRHSPHSRFILNLSSGMRVLNYEILTAFLLLNLDAEIEVELENQDGVVTWRIKDMTWAELDEDDKEIIRKVFRGDSSISELARDLKKSTSTVWRRVNRLIEQGYLMRESNGLTLTAKGRITAELLT